MPSKRIKVLTFDGCPNAMAAQALVDRIVADVDVGAEVASVRVPDGARRSASASSGSPTTRVDGTDVEPGAGDRTDCALACRVYATASGPSSLPAEGWLRTGCQNRARSGMAAALVFDAGEDEVCERVLCGADPDAHVAEVKEFADAGFDHVHVHQVGTDQETFFRFYGREVLPRVRDL